MPVITFPPEDLIEAKGPLVAHGGLTDGNVNSPHYSGNYDAAQRRKVSKSIHKILRDHRQNDDATVAAKLEPIHVATADGTIASFKVAVGTAPVGGTTGYTVDLKKVVGGVLTTVLSAVITVNDTNSNNWEIETATISDADYVAGDQFYVEVLLVGSGGTQGTAVIAQAEFHENG